MFVSKMYLITINRKEKVVTDRIYEFLPLVDPTGDKLGKLITVLVAKGRHKVFRGTRRLKSSRPL